MLAIRTLDNNNCMVTDGIAMHSDIIIAHYKRSVHSTQNNFNVDCIGTVVSAFQQTMSGGTGRHYCFTVIVSYIYSYLLKILIVTEMAVTS